ncbi:hypothetical protein C2857_001753 [Epichloe festucae Fl1]|uniref:Up-regulated in Daf-2 domain-containing protein n=1 Tax=Epichloe festucae (strain Fl1) TaxID=877507 RepID=A0A7S9PV60_EPIFF|nr:hypothetical protein C2857_001753 [Epichloe festucae Fl1]
MKVWDVIQPGEVTKETLTVNYDTGMNFGGDWWKLVGVSGADGQASVYYSDPQNYQAIIQALEKAATVVFALPGFILGGALGGKAGLMTGDPAATLFGAILGASSGSRAGQSAAEAVNINLERTSDELSNYWRFDLETVDDGQIVSIALNPNMTMEFESNLVMRVLGFLASQTKPLRR